MFIFNATKITTKKEFDSFVNDQKQFLEEKKIACSSSMRFLIKELGLVI